MATLDLLNLTKRFGEVTAVNDVTINVGDGEFLCILGPSGCGKSTALRMIGGFEEPTSGDVRIDGTSVIDLPPNRRPTAMVFQKYTLWPHMKVYDNIAFGLRLRRMPQREVDQEVNSALELVGLKNYGTRYPAQLSGGEQQRVALARALVLKPKILLLDEPFSSLDALLRVRLREELRLIQRQIHITAIFVTHDQEEALTLADRIAVMNRGKLEQMDKPSSIYAAPRSLFVADFIGTMNLLSATHQGATLAMGQQTLPAPGGLTNDSSVTVAIRPEDLALVSESAATQTSHWSAAVVQAVDLGHYRRATVDLAGVGRLKIYLPKAVNISDGETIRLFPMRYLVYQDHQPPIEMQQKPPEGALAFR